MPPAAQTSPGNYPRYALYCRKSTDEDERQIQSIASQKERAYTLALSTGKTITQVVEEARSAKEPGRPEFNRLLALVDAGEVDGIIAWHPDRLARNEMDAAAITMRLRKGVLKDLAFAEYFFHNSAEGIMMLQMALSQSQYQVSKLAIDVRRGLQDKIKKGWFPHRAPLGYLNDKHLNKGDKTISPDSERFDMLRKAWNLLLTGAYSVPQIVDLLNDEWGFRTPVTRSGQGGLPLGKSTLYRVFGSRFYAGYFIHNGILYKGAHPPMVTLDEYDRAQALIGRPDPATGAVSREGSNDKPGDEAATLDLAFPAPTRLKAQSRALPYVGLIRCGVCGGQVTGTVVRKPSGRTYTYYHCQGKGGCPRRCLREDRLEALIDAELARTDLLPEFYGWALEDIARSSAQEQEAREAVRVQRERALKSAEHQIENLVGMRLRDLITDEEFMVRRSTLVLERERLREEAAACTSGSGHAQASCTNVVEYSKNARAWLRSDDTSIKRIVARNLGSNYVLKDGNLLLEPHPLLVRVRDEYPALEARYQRIKLAGTGSQSTKKRHLRAVRSTWSGIWDANRTLAGQGEHFPNVAEMLRCSGLLRVPFRTASGVSVPTRNAA